MNNKPKQRTLIKINQGYSMNCLIDSKDEMLLTAHEKGNICCGLDNSKIWTHKCSDMMGSQACVVSPLVKVLSEADVSKLMNNLTWAGWWQHCIIQPPG